MSGEVQVLVSYSSTFLGFFLSGTGSLPVPLTYGLASSTCDVNVQCRKLEWCVNRCWQTPITIWNKTCITMYHLIEPCPSLVGSTYSIVYEKSAIVIFLWNTDCPFDAKVNQYGEQGNMFFKKNLGTYVYTSLWMSNPY
jgi:hypothetical protein